VPGLAWRVLGESFGVALSFFDLSISFFDGPVMQIFWTFRHKSVLLCLRNFEEKKPAILHKKLVKFLHWLTQAKRERKKRTEKEREFPRERERCWCSFDWWVSDVNCLGRRFVIGCFRLKLCWCNKLMWPNTIGGYKRPSLRTPDPDWSYYQ